MTDRFDDAKRSLEGVPAPDLWSEAERRAEMGAGAVALDPAADGRARRPVRWLAAAAVVAVIAGAIGLAARDDDQPNVRTDPTSEGTVVPLVPPTSDFPAFDGRCGFALDGEGPHEVIADGTSPWFSADSQPVEQQVAQLQLGATQTAEIAVPGVVLIDLVGERVEDVELARGTAQVWFSAEFVQVRWFTGSQDRCESFTVTVWGGTEDGNRHAAVDLAEQVRLPSDLRAAIDRTIEGDWVLAAATLDGEELSTEPLHLGFRDGTAAWDAGCNQASGAYEVVGATAIQVPDPSSTAKPCPNNPQATAIQRVMSSEVIALSTTADALVLRDDSVVDGATLTLRPAPDSSSSPTSEPPREATSEPYGIWPMTAPESIVGYLPEVTGTPEEVALAFAARWLEWSDPVIQDREPSEDGSFGTIFLITSSSTGGSVEVGVRPGAPSDAADPALSNVVYRVEVPNRLSNPDATARVVRDGSAGRIAVLPPPAGSASDIAYWIYGEYQFVGTMTEQADLLDTENWDGTDLTGAVLLLFRDADLDVISAWGVALPPGDVDLQL
mgnify:CR=1 FL=1